MISAAAETFATQEPIEQLRICDHPPQLDGFNAEKYMGIWYDIQHTADVWYLNNDDVCGEVEYWDLFTNDEGAKQWSVRNTSQPQGFGPRAGITARAKCLDETGHCFVDFGSGWTGESNYTIVETDYENYSIVYSCYSVFKSKVWILSRTPVMPDEYYDHAVEKIRTDLSHYDFDGVMNHKQYEGDQCNYEQIPTEQFLQ